LNALKRLAKHAPAAYQENGDEITPFVIQSLKRTSLNGDSSGLMDVDANGHPDFADWCADEDFLPEHQACVLGLKILTNRCLAVAEDPNASKVATQTIRVMTLILQAHGSPANFKVG
jgi:sister-chromatid-cohesion protein PDS5